PGEAEPHRTAGGGAAGEMAEPKRAAEPPEKWRNPRGRRSRGEGLSWAARGGRASPHGRRRRREGTAKLERRRSPGETCKLGEGGGTAGEMCKLAEGGGAAEPCVTVVCKL